MSAPVYRCYCFVSMPPPPPLAVACHSPAERCRRYEVGQGATVHEFFAAPWCAPFTRAWRAVSACRVHAVYGLCAQCTDVRERYFCAAVLAAAAAVL